MRRYGLPYVRSALGRIGPWPRFLIVGAGKCGTNSMLDLIAQHPDVTPPLYKEPQYFNTRYNRGDEWYRAMFYRPGTENQEDVFSGEATVSYFPHPAVPGRIREKCPGAKLIVLLRDPTARTISAYHFRRRLGNRLPPFEQWVANEIRETEEHIESGESTAISEKYPPNIVLSGLYARHLKRWFRHFPRPQFLVMPSRDFDSDYFETAARVYEFLGLAPYDRVVPRRLNVGEYAPPDAGIARRLDEFFASSLDELEALVGFRP